MPARFALRVFSFEVPMPVPTTLASLSTTAASNSPGGGENPFPDLDDHLRAGYAFDAQNRDAIATKLNASAVSAFGLTLIDDADAATARATLGAVGLTGNETVAGVKTFSSSPIVPTPTTGDNTTKAATTAFVKTTADASAAAVEAKVPGIGQTWQDVKASRAIGTTYTNSTARPIMVSIVASVNAGVENTLSVDGVVVSYTSVGVIGNGLPLTAIVPPGSSYVLTNTGGTSIFHWAELR